MSRTQPSDVKLIIDTSDLGDSDDEIIQSFIDDANAIVTDVVGSDTSLTDAQKASIEKWLTAHLLASTLLRQAQEEAAEQARIIYEGKTGLGLQGTRYGQQVLMIDTSGKFAQGSGKKRASIRAVTSFE